MSRARVEVKDHVQKPWRGMHWIRRADGVYEDSQGVLTTKYGLVHVHLWTWRVQGRDEQMLYMTTVVDGEEHTRWERRTPSRAITKRGAAIIAGRWIRELVEKEGARG